MTKHQHEDAPDKHTKKHLLKPQAEQLSKQELWTNATNTTQKQPTQEGTQTRQKQNQAKAHNTGKTMNYESNNCKSKSDKNLS